MRRADVLTTAVKAAIANGCDRKSISVPHWSETYKVTQKQVREAWEAALTSVPPNTGIVGEGK